MKTKERLSLGWGELILILFIVLMGVIFVSCAEIMYLGASANCPCNEEFYEYYKEECDRWAETYPREYAAFKARVAYKAKREEQKKLKAINNSLKPLKSI